MALQLNDLKPVIDWLQANPGLASFAVFFISCAESLAIVGLFIPGTIIMPAIGGMIGAGVLPAPWIILAAILGAMVGDNLSYWLGHHFHEKIRGLWPFNHFPQLLNKGVHFFHKYGGISVFIGRFAGPVRPIIPVIAGMLGMTSTRFFIANLTSAIAWALIYMAPGILIGMISEQLTPHVAGRLLMMLLIIALGIWLLTWSLNACWNYAHRHFERFCKHHWDKDPTYYRLIHHYHVRNHKPLAIVFYIVFLIVLLTLISVSVAQHGNISYVDWFVFLSLRSIEIAPLDTIFACLYNLTQPITLISISALLILGLIWQKTWRVLFYWLFNIAFTALIIFSLQHLIHMTPPELHTQQGLWNRYPNLLLGLFTALLGNFLICSYYTSTWSRYKKSLLLLMLFLITCAGLPELYFGLNWLSSDIASVICAAISTWVCILFFYRTKSTVSLKPLLFTISITGILVTSMLSINNSQTFIAQLENPEFSINFSLSKWWNNETLPIATYRKNILDEPTEALPIQYAGNLQSLMHTLEHQGWHVVPKASILVILNRIGAKNRSNQLPLFPDLYHTEKPNLIMTKEGFPNHQMLVLRLWPSQTLLQPHNIPLWLGTLQFHRIWHWHAETPKPFIDRLALLIILQHDITPTPMTLEDALSNTDKLSCMPSPRGAATAACTPLPHTRARGSGDHGYMPNKIVAITATPSCTLFCDEPILKIDASKQREKNK